MKSILNRIKMQELVDALNTLTFEEVTEENLKRLLPHADLYNVNQMYKTTKDIDIDGYMFTVHKMTESEKVPHDWLRPHDTDKTLYLSDIVEIFLPVVNSNNSEFLQADGVIIDVDGELRLDVGFTVE